MEEYENAFVAAWSLVKWMLIKGLDKSTSRSLLIRLDINLIPLY